MFTKIDGLMWSDTKFKQLSNESKLLFVYVLTCNHRKMLGLYHLPIPYGAYDLGWSEERFTKGLRELLDKGLINYNFETNIILIPNFLKYNPLENQNQVKGAMRALETIPINGLDTGLINVLKGLDKPFIKPLLKLFEELLAKGYAKQEEEEGEGEGEGEGEEKRKGSKRKEEKKEDISLQIENLRLRYSPEELSVIDEYFGILRFTRRNGMIADSVVAKIYTEWEKHSISKVIYALNTYISNPRHHDKQENYCYGIMRNAKAEEVEAKIFNKTPIEDDNPFLNRGARNGA